MTAVQRRRVTATITDRYGNTVADEWTDTPLHGAIVAPVSSTEPTDAGRSAVVVGWTLYCPPRTELHARDRVVWAGRVYDVEGEPSLWDNPFSPHHGGLVATLREVRG